MVGKIDEKLKSQIQNRIELVETLLMPLEYEVFLNAVFNRRPLSVGDHYKLILAKRLEQIRQTASFDLSFIFSRKKNAQKKEDTEEDYHIHAEDMTSKDKVTIEKALRKNDVDFPSYAKIKTTLKTLKDWDLIFSREVTGQKEKEYWFLNPILTKEYLDTLLDYNAERVKKTEAEKQKF